MTSLVAAPLTGAEETRTLKISRSHPMTPALDDFGMTFTVITLSIPPERSLQFLV